MWRGISLANKCLLLFGGAVLLIVFLSLWIPWVRMTALIDAGQLELSRQMVDTWERLGEDEQSPQLMGPPDARTPAGMWTLPRMGGAEREDRGGVVARQLTIEQAAGESSGDPFLARALATFRDDPNAFDVQDASWDGTTRDYRYAKAVRVVGASGARLTHVIALQRRSIEATRLLIFNTGFLLLSGVVVLALAVLVFYLITQRIILEPVRALRETAERVREGNLAIRSEIRTGDEFEELAETFNSMLTDLQSGQDRLRAINAALDLKLHEMAESNTSLYQAAKIKGEFLANVSHELRTPLNSIIGFAELLQEIAKTDSVGKDPVPSLVAKRLRYIDNILNAGRGLLTLINSLLEMARIEAGRVELHVERMNMRDACEALLGLIAPLAARKSIVLKLEVADDVPPVRTDHRKFQQIIFNFLSNAVKFSEPTDRTGRTPQIIVRAEKLFAGAPDGQPRVRVSVIDNGPGISKEDQEQVFEKFFQVDGGHTREQSGTGLGLAISKELASILQCEIQLVSEVGRGSMFSLIMPLDVEATQASETALEARFRGSLTGGRTWS